MRQGLFPGASFAYIERAVELSDRMSLNLEVPNQAWLNELAPTRSSPQNLHEPVEVTRASRATLLKIPGIGPRSADRIIEAHRETRLCDLSQLKVLGVTTGWAAPYVLLNGRPAAVQLRLW